MVLKFHAHYVHWGGLNLFVQFALATHYVSKWAAAEGEILQWNICSLIIINNMAFVSGT